RYPALEDPAVRRPDRPGEDDGELHPVVPAEQGEKGPEELDHLRQPGVSQGAGRLGRLQRRDLDPGVVPEPIERRAEVAAAEFPGREAAAEQLPDAFGTTIAHFPSPIPEYEVPWHAGGARHLPRTRRETMSQLSRRQVLTAAAAGVATLAISRLPL